MTRAIDHLPLLYIAPGERSLRDTPALRAAIIAGILADFALDHRPRSPAEVLVAAYERHGVTQAEAGQAVVGAIQTLVAARLVGCSMVFPETGHADLDPDAVLTPTLHLAVYMTTEAAATVRN